jgi:hypothetical protein
MTETLRTWLKRNLDQIVSIQHSVIGEEADVIAFSWSGVRLHIHLIDQPVKLRALKKTLQSATERGINTLFLLDARLLVADGERFDPKDWLLAIHALTGERIYAYRLTKRGVELIQAHFQPIIGLKAYKMWYGPAVPFTRMRFFRNSVKYRHLKGDWLTADFDTPNFWQNTDYRYFQKRHDDTRKRQRNTKWQEWSGYQTWQNADGKNGRPLQNPLQDYLSECYAILGVEISADQEAVKCAFRKLAIGLHPDTSDLPEDEAQARFHELNAAYEYIKSANGWT